MLLNLARSNSVLFTFIETLHRSIRISQELTSDFLIGMVRA